MNPAVSAAQPLDPDADLTGRLVVLAPHMDDELIGCGALLASVADGGRVTVVYVTDGAGSPEPPTPWHDVDRPALARMRREEALAGLEALGIPPGRARFLELPDGRLGRMGSRLRAALAETLADLRPRHVLIPFRMDRHPDHLAVHRSALHPEVRAASGDDCRVHEYFVYSQWKLLPGGDIRAWIDPGLLRALEPSDEAGRRKRRALELHRTQSTLHYSWQRRPNLTPAFLDRVTAEPELLLDTFRAPSGMGVFRGGTMRIRAAHSLEPVLKRAKDRVMALVRK